MERVHVYHLGLVHLRVTLLYLVTATAAASPLN